MSKFRYTVTPVGVIKLESLGNVGIRSPKTLDLTLDEVKVCLKKAKVYRRFNGSLIKKVTLSNCERLHNEEYISEEDYKDFVIKNKSKDRGTVKETEDVQKQIENTINNVNNLAKEYVDKFKEGKDQFDKKLFKDDELKVDVKGTVEEVKKEEKVEETKTEEVKEESTDNSNNNSSKPSVNINKNKKHK